MARPQKRKALRAPALAAALLLACAVSAHAGWIGSSVAEASFDFFGEFAPASSRATAGAGSAEPRGAQGLFLSPAVFPDSVLVLGADFADDPFGGQSGSVAAIRRAGAFAFHFAMAASRLYAVEELDERAEATGRVHEPGSTFLSTGISWKFRDFVFGYDVGLATDRITRREKTALGWAMNAGAFWNATRRLNLSLAMMRFGRRESAYVEGGDAKGWLPAEFVLGSSTRIDRRGRVRLLADLVWPAFGESSARVGLKWNALPDLLTVKAGTEIDMAQVKWARDQLTAGPNRAWRPQTQELFAVGVSLTPDRWGVDYALGALREGAGLRHALGLRLEL